MTSRYRHEDHSPEPIIDEALLDSSMNFSDWNTLVSKKMKQLEIAQHIGSSLLEHKDQEDIDLLYRVFPKHHAEMVRIINEDMMLNE